VEWQTHTITTQKEGKGREGKRKKKGNFGKKVIALP
jgi:hypothetical protein